MRRGFTRRAHFTLRRDLGIKGSRDQEVPAGQLNQQSRGASPRSSATCLVRPPSGRKQKLSLSTRDCVPGNTRAPSGRKQKSFKHSSALRVDTGVIYCPPGTAHRLPGTASLATLVRPPGGNRSFIAYQGLRPAPIARLPCDLAVALRARIIPAPRAHSIPARPPPVRPVLRRIPRAVQKRRLRRDTTPARRTARAAPSAAFPGQ